MAGTDPRLFGVSPQRLKVSAHKWVMALLSESLAHQPARSPTRLGTKAGFEPLPDSSRLTIKPVRLPCDFQRSSKNAATSHRLLIPMRVGCWWSGLKPTHLVAPSRQVVSPACFQTTTRISLRIHQHGWGLIQVNGGTGQPLGLLTLNPHAC